MPPMVLHKGVRVQDMWKLKALGDIKIAATPKGYITKSRFHEYGFALCLNILSKWVWQTKTSPYH